MRRASQEVSSEQGNLRFEDAHGAQPVPPKPATSYDRAIEQPRCITKKEEDSCLTCIRNNRRCKGTNLQIVNGRRRCQNCATSSKGCSGRFCYWSYKERGVVTFEYAVRIMWKELGGPLPAKNTQQGRLKRQQQVKEKRAESDSSHEEADTKEEPKDDTSKQQGEHTDDVTDKNFDDSESVSAAAPSHSSLYDMITRDTRFPENAAHTTTFELEIERESH